MNKGIKLISAIVLLIILLISGCSHSNNTTVPLPPNTNTDTNDQFTLTNTSSASIDLTLQSNDLIYEPSIVYCIDDGYQYTISLRQLTDIANTSYNKPSWIVPVNSDGDAVFYSVYGHKKDFNYSFFVFNHAKQIVTIIFGVDCKSDVSGINGDPSALRQFWTLPKPNVFQPMTGQLFNFELNIDGYVGVMTSRLYFDIYDDGKFIGSAYIDKDFNGIKIN